MIVFRSLTKDDINKIVGLELEKVANRLKEHQITLQPTPAALQSLAEQGYDAEMGARPLRRVIQFQVEDQLSDGLLSGTFTDGDTVQIDLDEDGKIIMKKVDLNQPQAEAI